MEDDRELSLLGLPSAESPPVISTFPLTFTVLRVIFGTLSYLPIRPKLASVTFELSLMPFIYMRCFL